MPDGAEPTNVTNHSGVANLNAQGDIDIGGDIVGRDKITHITNIYEASTVGVADSRGDHV